jgi:SAM-dependent methyltransferase
MADTVAETDSPEAGSDLQWQQFFGHPSFMRFATAILTEERTRLEVAALTEWLHLGADVQVLDLGCGYGRIAVPLAKLGCRVMGLDGSAPQLDRARQAAASAGVSIEFLQQDMRIVPATATRFDVVINMSTALGYADDPAGDLHTFRHVREVLRPGGRFLIDTENRDAKVRTAGTAEFQMAGTRIMCVRTFDPLSGRWREILTWGEDGRREQSVFDVRLYSATELITMLEAAGLELIRAWGWFDGSKYTLDSHRTILLARRPLDANA